MNWCDKGLDVLSALLYYLSRRPCRWHAYMLHIPPIICVLSNSLTAANLRSGSIFIENTSYRKGGELEVQGLKLKYYSSFKTIKLQLNFSILFVRRSWSFLLEHIYYLLYTILLDCTKHYRKPSKEILYAGFFFLNELFHCQTCYTNMCYQFYYRWAIHLCWKKKKYIYLYI